MTNTFRSRPGEDLTAPGFNVTVDGLAVATMTEQLREFPDVERGGILSGEWVDDYNLRIVRASPVPSDSVSLPANFTRGVEGLNEWLRGEYSDGRSYVGEWHTHPSGFVEPSLADADFMKSIAADTRYQCEDPACLIIGPRPGGYALSIFIILFGEVLRFEVEQ